MKSCVSAVSTLLAAICAILFVFLASLSVFVFTADRMLFSAGTYKQALSNQHIYDRLPALIAEQIAYQVQHDPSTTGLAPELKRLTEPDWQILIADLTTPNELKTQVESILDQLITYLNTPSSSLSLKVSVVDFKRNLQGDAGYRALTQIINAQPACTAQEWEQIVSNVQSAQFENIPFCRPPAEVMAAAEPFIRAALLDLTPAIPDVIYLDNQTGASGTELLTRSDRLTLQRAHTWILVSLFFAAGLLVLTLVFGVRSLTGCGLWLGIPLLLTGISVFCAALITWRIPNFNWNTPGYSVSFSAQGGHVTIPGAAPGVTQAIVDVSASIAHSAATTLGIVGVVLALLGGGILAAGLLLGMARRADF
jgi:hypothetical protein